MQGTTKRELADFLKISITGLRYKLSIETNKDFIEEDMCEFEEYLRKSIDYFCKKLCLS